MKEVRTPFMGPLETEYKTRCQWPGCNGVGQEFRIPTEHWRVGMIVTFDPSDPTIGRCTMCKRHTMMVVEAPDLPAPQGPEGFWRLPTK